MSGYVVTVCMLGVYDEDEKKKRNQRNRGEERMIAI